MQLKHLKGKLQLRKPLSEIIQEQCAQNGAFHFGEQTLCQDCYSGAGSCCPEFGKDDLWSFPEQD
jgi:hypothetical protein